MTKRFYVQGEQIGGTSYYYAKDHLGGVREMTDGTGTIQARYDYDPYGRRTRLSGTLDADFGYTGYYTSSQWGNLAFAPLRIYSPDLGRFISRDPIAENGGINLYRYVGNRPLNHRDRRGLVAGFDDALELDIGLGLLIGEALLNTALAVTITNAIGDAIGNALSENQRETPKKECHANPAGPSTNPNTPDPNDDDPDWKYGSHKSPQRWQNKMQSRGWTEDQITEAINEGESFPAENKVNPGNTATRLVNPTTGRSVIQDDVTKEILQVARDGWY